MGVSGLVAAAMVVSKAAEGVGIRGDVNLKQILIPYIE